MSGETVLEHPDEARIRRELEEMVVHDLHGPFGDEEEFRERPTDRYIVGRLGPERMPSEEHVVVRDRTRRHDGGLLVSVFLVNTTPRPPRLEAAAWVFQARMSVTAVDDGPVFRARPDTSVGGAGAGGRVPDAR